MAKYHSVGDYIGLGMSFGATMLVSIAVFSFAGKWLDEKLGFNGVCVFIGMLLGILSGFRVFLENVKRMEDPYDLDERGAFWDKKN